MLPAATIIEGAFKRATLALHMRHAREEQEQEAAPRPAPASPTLAQRNAARSLGYDHALPAPLGSQDELHDAKVAAYERRKAGAKARGAARRSRHRPSDVSHAVRWRKERVEMQREATDPGLSHGRATIPRATYGGGARGLEQGQGGCCGSEINWV